MPRSSRLASLATRDATYRFLLNEQPLLERHSKDLKRRGLSRESVERLGYCSWGSSKYTRGPLAQQALERDPGAIDVPGIALRDQGRGPYLSLTGAPGIALPLRTADGQIQALQIANDDRSQAKYVFLSSAHYGGSSSGSPVHIARPTAPREPGRVWVGEGILKSDIAAEYLGQVVIGIAGVSAIKALPDALLELERRGELTSLVVALDMDYKQNENVKRARALIAEQAARLGIPVFLADWDERLKGLDDLLVAGGRPKLTPYQVKGNGIRPLERAPEAAAEPKTPKLSLAEARHHQQKALDDYLHRDRLAEDITGPVGLFLASPPGTGKSHAITKSVQRFIRKRSRAQVGVIVSRHDQAKGEGRDGWRQVRGRTHELPGQSIPCAFPQQQRKLVELRVTGQAGCNACPKNAACQANIGRSNDEPFYLNQLRPDPLARVSVFQAAHFLTPTAWSHVRTLILDDVAVRDLQLEKVTLSRPDLEFALNWSESHSEASYALAQPLLHLLSELVRHAPTGEFSLSGAVLFEKLEQLAGEHGIGLADALAQARQARDPDPFPEGANLASASLDLPRRFLSDLVAVLTHEHLESQREREIAGWNRRIEVSRELGEDVVLTLSLRRPLPAQALERVHNLVVSDASTTVDELQEAFPHIARWIVVRPEVEMPPTVKMIQYIDRGYGKRALHGRKGEENTLQQDALEEIRKIRQLHPGQKIGLVTYKFFAAIAKKKFPDLVVSHFYGQRGSNRLADCDALISLGTPRPEPKSFLASAEALHWDGPPIYPQTVLEAQRVGPYVTRTREYVDARLRQLARAKTQEEMLQSVGRIRPLSVLGYVEKEQLEMDFGAEEIKKAQEQQRRAASVYIFSNQPLPGLDVEVRRSDPRMPRPELQTALPDMVPLEVIEAPAPSLPDPTPTASSARPGRTETLDLFGVPSRPVELAIAVLSSTIEPRITGPPAHAPPRAG